VNIGAGTGNYEPADRTIVAVEPSTTMLQQRAAGATHVVRAVAEALPFSDRTFDAALAVLTVHHWADLERGLLEMQRVAVRQVILFFEPALAGEFWLVREYFPEILALGSERAAPSAARLVQTLGQAHIEPVPVPADCVDGFAGSFWKRPEAYLEPSVQDGMSSFAQLDPHARARGTEQLRRDLVSGAWDARHRGLRERSEMDLGYRLLVAEG
jgi:SAM-dependent methyltransferase